MHNYITFVLSCKSNSKYRCVFLLFVPLAAALTLFYDAFRIFHFSPPERVASLFSHKVRDILWFSGGKVLVLGLVMVVVVLAFMLLFLLLAIAVHLPYQCV